MTNDKHLKHYMKPAKRCNTWAETSCQNSGNPVIHLFCQQTGSAGNQHASTTQDAAPRLISTRLVMPNYRTMRFAGRQNNYTS